MKKTNTTTDLFPMSASFFTVGAILNLLGGINMFGMNEKTPQKLAEEMMAGAVRGILEHFEWKIDEQKNELKSVYENKEKLENEIVKLQEEIMELKNKKK